MLCLDAGCPPPSPTEGGGHGGGGRRDYLLVVRRAPVGPGLSESLAGRCAAGPCSFHVISLARSTSVVMLLASAGDPGSGYVSCPDPMELKHEEGRVAEAVLDAWLRLFDHLGLAADGEVSEVGPVESVARAIANSQPRHCGGFAEALLVEQRCVMAMVANALGFDAARRVRRRVGVAVARVAP